MSNNKVMSQQHALHKEVVQFNPTKHAMQQDWHNV
jgi:hypothetical protein